MNTCKKYSCGWCGANMKGGLSNCPNTLEGYHSYSSCDCQDCKHEKELDNLKTKIGNVLSGNGYYQVHFPDGSIQNLTWGQLHGGLQYSDPEIYLKVKYRWVSVGSK